MHHIIYRDAIKLRIVDSLAQLSGTFCIDPSKGHLQD